MPLLTDWPSRAFTLFKIKSLSSEGDFAITMSPLLILLNNFENR